MRRWLIATAAVLLMVAAGTGLWLRAWWTAPLSVPAGGELLYVAPGETLGIVAPRLAERGVLRRPWLLKLAARLGDLDARMRSGEYLIAAGTTPAGLLALLQSDATVRYSVTLPEGITLAQALQLLHESPALVAEVSDADDPRLLEMVAPATSAEGWFLPETYQYQRGDSDLDVLRQAHTMLRRTLDELWQRRPVGLPYRDPQEALIMASIVERETGVAEERGRIAGVFVRRLQRRMRLQTDPTVIYGLGPRFDGNLTRAHLRDANNPFNTYRHHGLPPTPICLPGSAALAAALDPSPGDALYFVARGDGTHAFSATLEDHEEAVRQYQLQRRADYRSSPPGAGP